MLIFAWIYCIITPILTSFLCFEHVHHTIFRYIFTESESQLFLALSGCITFFVRDIRILLQQSYMSVRCFILTYMITILWLPVNTFAFNLKQKCVLVS